MSAVFDVLPEQLAARARLELLFDAGTFRPIRTGVGDGVLSGSGRVQGRAVVAWAQDGSFKGGSLGSSGGETIARTIARADALGVPVVGFPHSGGARLQEGVAALTAYAAIFRAQAQATVPMISVVSGPCAGGAAYSPALGDFVVMTADAVMFLTGPKIIERVTREVISASDLGGVKVQGANGVSHMVARDDVHAAELVRELLTFLPDRVGHGTPMVPPADAPGEDPGDVLPASDRQVYDVREIAARLLDRGSFFELAPRWARNLVVGFGRIEGRAVGVIANQAKHLGGCLDAAAAEKGAWFVDMCDRFGIPLVVLADTPGFLPGATQEAAGVLRHGASLLRAFGRASVPRVTVSPNARIGVMGARQAVELVRRREIEAGADAAVLADAYEAEHLPVRVAAAAGFVDEVVVPSETRDRIAHILELAKT
jgi:acetyl-CoA carboxylase carboxyltransferase component